MGEKSPNEGYFCKIPIIKKDTNFISQTFGQTNFLPQTLQLAYPKTCGQGFSSDFEQFYLVKSNFVYFIKTNMASKLFALKIVELAHMLEFKKLKMFILKTKDGLLKTKDSLENWRHPLEN